VNITRQEIEDVLIQVNEMFPNLSQPKQTVREMVHEIQTELRTTDVSPSRAAELLVKLTALMGNCLEEIRNADHAYALVLLGHLEADTAANRAKIRAETTQEYLWKRETRDTKEIVVEMSRSLKYLLRSQAEEMRLTR